jgi:TonB-dependent receptor
MAFYKVVPATDGRSPIPLTAHNPNRVQQGLRKQTTHKTHISSHKTHKNSGKILSSFKWSLFGCKIDAVILRQLIKQNTHQMTIIKNLMLSFFMLAALNGFAQNAQLKGKVFDKSGEALTGVNVSVIGAQYGEITDLDGAFYIELPEGNYALEFSYISYQTKKIDNITLSANEVKVLPDIILEEEAQALGEVVIQASAIENNDNALAKKQQNAENFLDAVSSKSIQKTGDNNVAAAVRRISGVTIDNGKYVVVRGLGDRYSKSILNGLDLPGLDPEKNAVQLDLFPTNILDNIIVYKTFTPNLPGDFVGGLVDIATKDFVDKKTISISTSLTYDVNTHFKKDFILYNGSKLDWLGMGKLDRELPFDKTAEMPNPNSMNLTAEEQTQIRNNIAAINKELEAVHKNNFLNQNLSFNIGNYKNIKKGILGINFTLNYRNTYKFTPNAEYNNIRVVSAEPPFGGQGGLGLGYDTLETQKGNIGQQNIIWNGFLSGAYKYKNNRLALYVLHTQSGERRATQREIDDRLNSHRILSQNLEYFQKMITNIILTGNHVVGAKHRIEWANSFTNSAFSDPDLAYTDLVMEGNDTLLQAGGTSGVNKLFRNLKEINDNVKADYTFEFKQWSGLASKLKIGAANVYKQRNFETYSLSIQADPSSDPRLAHIVGGANTILQDGNLWHPQNDTGYYISSIINNLSDQYRSSVNTLAAYAMLTLPLHSKLNLIAGVRMEYTLMKYTGTDRLSYQPIDKQTVLNSVKPLPSVNLVYKASAKLNVRAAYNRTLARPSFREKSQLVIYDPIIDQFFIGNLDLVETDIDNLDLRLEYYFGGGDLVSLTGFYKSFRNPIEIQPYNNMSPNDLWAVNRDRANMFGVEFELRKNLAFIHKKLDGLQLGANLTCIKSAIVRSADEQTKYLKFNQKISNKRAMQGQAPFMVNAFISYFNPQSKTELNLSYNVKGKTLSIVSIGDYPYIYEDPFHNLDFKITQKLGKSDRFTLGFKAGNLLGDSRRQYYQFQDLEQVNYRNFKESRSFTLEFAWRM